MIDISLFEALRTVWVFFLIFPLSLVCVSLFIRFISRSRNKPTLFTSFQYHLWKFTPEIKHVFQDSLWTYFIYSGMGGGVILIGCKYVIDEGFPSMLLIPLTGILVTFIIRFLFDVQHNLEINKEGESIKIREMEKELKRMKEIQRLNNRKGEV